MIISIVIIIMIGAILVFSQRQITNTSEKDSVTEEIVTGIFQINLLTNEYFLNPKTRVVNQWNLQQDNIGKVLESQIFKETEDQIIFENIAENHQSIKTIFLQLTNIGFSLKTFCIFCLYSMYFCNAIIASTSRKPTCTTSVLIRTNRIGMGHFFKSH